MVESGADPQEFTRLLTQSREEGKASLDRLFPLVYDELRALARALLARRAPQTLATTGVVHEAYLKLVDASRLRIEDRAHFFALAARAMRQILVDHARRRIADKRGGELQRVPFDEVTLAIEEPPLDIDQLDQALGRLQSLDGPLGQLVELRFFGGLPLEEIATLQDRSVRTLKRDWRKARAFLYRELSGTAPAGPT